MIFPRQVFAGLAGCLLLSSVELHADSTVEGKLLAISRIPDAAKSDYPNCNYTATVEVHQILDGESIPEKAVLVLRCFRERQFTPEAAFQKGTLIRAQIRKFDEMPQSFQQIQQSDDNDDLELPYFAAVKAGPIKHYTIGNFPLPDQTTATIAWRQQAANSPQSEESRKIRRRQMDRTLERIESEIEFQQKHYEKYRETFISWEKQAKVAAAVSPGINEPGKYFATWQGNTFFTMPWSTTLFSAHPAHIRHRQHSFQGSLSQLKALDRFLRFHNIDLVVAVMPNMTDIALPVLCSEMKGFRRLELLKLCRYLLDNDIDWIDLFPPVTAGRSSYLLCHSSNRFDEHPHSGLIVASGKAIADYLLERGSCRMNLLPEGKLVKTEDRYWTNLWKVKNGRFEPDTPVEAIKVDFGEKLALDPAAEILIAGNSFSTYPVGGGAIGNLIAFHTWSPYSWIGGEAGALSIPAKLLRSAPSGIHGKKVMVLFVGQGHLTDPAWQNIELLAKVTEFRKMPLAMLKSNALAAVPKELQASIRRQSATVTWEPPRFHCSSPFLQMSIRHW